MKRQKLTIQVGDGDDKASPRADRQTDNRTSQVALRYNRVHDAADIIAAQAAQGTSLRGNEITFRSRSRAVERANNIGCRRLFPVRVRTEA